jgi:hypothetical protein
MWYRGKVKYSGFGGLVVSMLASGTQDRGFKPDRKKNAFLRRGSKAVCPMSQLCGMLKNQAITWKSDCLAKFDRSFSPIIPPFANRGLSSRLEWSTFGDELVN